MRLMVIVCLLSLIGSCISLPEEPAILQVSPVIDQRTLPQRCEHLSRKTDPGTWNPVIEEYPRNYAWEECIGVGRK